MYIYMHIYFNGGIWLFCSLRFTPPRLPSSSTLFSLIHFIDCMRFFVMLQTSAKQLTNSNMPQESVSVFPLAFFSLSRSLFCPLVFLPALFLSFIVVRRMQSISARARQKALPTFVRCQRVELQAALK